MLKQLVRGFSELLNQPMKVLWICMGLVFASVILDGSFLRLYGLYRDHQHILNRIEEGKLRSKQLEFRIHEAQQPEFIERQVRDQFDLVKEGDLVFVFSDEAGS